jgi:hypothetical protein
MTRMGRRVLRASTATETDYLTRGMTRSDVVVVNMMMLTFPFTGMFRSTNGHDQIIQSCSDS